MSSVPDYRGMFLRGLGSQDYTDSYGTVTHSSGAINTTQGDASRNVISTLGPQQFGAHNGGAREGIRGETNNVFYYTNGPVENGMASFPRTYNGYSPNPYFSTSFGNGWDEALTHYRYQLSGDKDSGYVLQEYTEKPSLWMFAEALYLYMDLSLQIPTDTETRPANKAVRYMIKAR